MSPKTVKKALKDAIQATNLDASAFPLHDIKRLYAMRWGIEKLTQKSSASFTYIAIQIQPCIHQQL